MRVLLLRALMIMLPDASMFSLLHALLLSSLLLCRAIDFAAFSPAIDAVDATPL